MGLAPQEVGDGVRDLVVIPLHRALELALEELADSIPGGNSDVGIAGREVGGTLELAVLHEKVSHTRVQDGRDLATPFGLDAELSAAEEAGGARLDHVRRVAVWRRAEMCEQRRAG